jgi:hypothetical protein
MKEVAPHRGLAQAVDAGAYWVRTSAFHWDKIEPVRTEPPTYRWQEVDELSLLAAAAEGLRVIAPIQFTPEWAQGYSGYYCGPIRDENLDEFAQFLGALVARYGAPPYNVKYWELGNEPDVDPRLVNPRQGYGCWGDESDEYYGGGYYAEMLKVAYPAMKQADPEARVMIGGLLMDRPAGGKDTSPRFLEGILEGGGGPFFDIVSFHAYTYYGGALGKMWNGNWLDSPTAMPGKVAHIRRLLDRFGVGDKGLINTEAALQCSEVTDECLETQAMFVARVYAEALALDLEAQVYFAMINEGWRHTGLVLPDLTPKPVYYAYQVAAEILTQAQYDGSVASYPPQVEGYVFRLNDRTGYVDVIWSADGTAQRVTLPAGASAHDRYGEPVAGTGTISVGSSPVYVTRPSLP